MQRLTGEPILVVRSILQTNDELCMNERIKDIAEQAEKYADDNFRGEPTWSEAFESKFAELIVRECGVALAPMLRDMVSRGQAYDLIKKHFGVEE